MNGIITFAANMGGPRDCHTEWNKSDRERDMISVKSKRKWYKWTSL